MRGWFDAFRSDGGPTLYSYSNRTPVSGDVHLITIFVIFCTIFTAFVIIFPGIRKERLTTFLTVTLSLFVGTTIQVAQYGSTWHTASTTVVSSYSAFSREKMTAEVGGYIGLMHINITYTGGEGHNDVEFNERFWWRSPTEMSKSFKEALHRGAPFPILSVAEYFSLHQEGFSWGSRYREAGYYSSIMLWTSFASWAMMNLLLMVVPRYGAYSMVCTGICMLLTNLTYWSLLPCEPLVAHVDGSILIFNLGWNYWLVLVAGVGCLFAGLVIAAIDLIFPHQFSTILEVDYDTPYDRHVIIEESFDTRNTRRKLPKIEDAFGERIMRQLSHKLGNGRDDTKGVINQGYVGTEQLEFAQPTEEDPNKNQNWSYPFPPSPRRTIN
ncbi:dual oxidase maturation factor 1 [Neodiprion pinetum]|uniref:Dual oxidase maturation factor 1 n=1 Tax=Neodiprion lecontei TaxID=441921 RepID=A0A6J0C1E5_NEOLC|nr:dual oxidase maturation factor 1 [Neodiprion lecontei]XP_046410860.1 dual oxidase maturation factor 1 [Neodiprion fabricii]XP_046410861.1 dual oxidase maturation factor 1 [Neodiprion fabricii]XP_046410862.1 dual oxidase maturation factor 1 [Neodiprion fabricii]XP_046410863.1 dual oxidase maturation factor 1 [Neodiprion fabricii]XP_046466437.1 dual oxidase maturation factor 1 [Neodiprion pinetum]XP_046466438.1 dual oxidase maturation factor 1 [Neodiprion pinetum]XP_046586637.1 dual oxidase